jgi:hypothetical protein
VIGALQLLEASVLHLQTLLIVAALVAVEGSVFNVDVAVVLGRQELMWVCSRVGVSSSAFELGSRHEMLAFMAAVHLVSAHVVLTSGFWRMFSVLDVAFRRRYSGLR